MATSYSRSSEIYLDANATTPVLPLAAKAAFDVMEQMYGNPSSSHITGLRARYILESARRIAGKVLGAATGRMVFTSGATEAIETAVFSTLCQLRQTEQKLPRQRVLLYGATEHKAVPQALEHWNRTLGIGDEVLAIPVDQDGALDLDFLRQHIASADMVCTMAVNNETGVIHDLAAIEAILRDAPQPVSWLVDCVQAVSKIPLQLDNSLIDYAPISGHKLFAPKGIGALYVRDGAPLVPLFAGGGQEGGARGGTENLPGVAAIGAVLCCLDEQDRTVFRDHDTLVQFRDRLVASLRKAFPKVVFNTPFETAVPTTINFSVPGFTSKEILDLFDAAGIRVSSGSACGSALQGSYVLEAMGLPAWRSEGAIRVSFGCATAEDDIASACRRIEEAGKAMCDSCLIVSHDVDTTTGATLDGLIQLKKGSMCSWLLLDGETKNCVIFDPFAELAERIESIVRCQGSRIVAILDTHQHVDHDSPRELLMKVLGDLVVQPHRPTDVLGWPAAPDGTVTLETGELVPFLQVSASDMLARTALPGHTVDAQVYLLGRLNKTRRLAADEVRFAFPGDTLQIGGIGRSDFPTSAPDAMLESLRKLQRIIGPHTIICATHDYANGFCTSLAAECGQNSFLQEILDRNAELGLEEFLTRKQAIDNEIDDDTNAELVCGLISEFVESDSSIDIRPDELKEFFQQRSQARIIDVREPHEFKFAQDWDALGLAEPPINVPLTRLSEFFQLLTTDDDESDMIFVCRSGNRSGKAAEAARRLGHLNAWHIAGGIALGASRAPGDEREEVEYSI